MTEFPLMTTGRASRSWLRRGHSAAAIAATLVLVVAACSTSVEVVSDAGLNQPTVAPRATLTPEATPEPSATATPEPTVTPTPTPPPPGVIQVTDNDAVGTVGDELLSLVEAVTLANGRLSLDQLSAAEQALVSGVPGSTQADTISVGLGIGGEIVFPGGNVWIIELFGNSGDVLRGSGSVLRGNGEAGVSHNVMLVGSSDVTIDGFTFADVTQAIGVESAGSDLAGITISNNSFTDIVVRDITMQNSLSESVISDVTISGNTFDAPNRLSDIHSFVTVRGGSGLEGQQTSASSVEGLVITANTFTARNDSTPTCVSIAAGHVPFGVQGSVAGAMVTDVRIANNTIIGCATAVELVGGLADQASGSVTDSAISGVVLGDNTLSVGTTGVDIAGGRVAPVPTSFQFSEEVDVQMSGNAVDNVTIATMNLSDVSTGIAMTGGQFEVSGTGAADGNIVAAVSVSQLFSEGVGVLCTEAADVGALATGNTLQTPCASISTS